MKISIWGIFAAIVGAIFTVYLNQTGTFTSADVRFETQQYDTANVCPSVLNVDIGQFTIYLNNQNGNRPTDVIVELSSPDNITFIKRTFQTNMAAGQRSVPFEFLINHTTLKKRLDYGGYSSYEPINSCSLNIRATYFKDVWKHPGQVNWPCNYSKQGSSLVLIPSTS